MTSEQKLRKILPDAYMCGDYVSGYRVFAYDALHVPNIKLAHKKRKSWAWAEAYRVAYKELKRQKAIKEQK